MGIYLTPVVKKFTKSRRREALFNSLFSIGIGNYYASALPNFLPEHTPFLSLQASSKYPYGQFEKLNV